MRSGLKRLIIRLLVFDVLLVAGGIVAYWAYGRYSTPLVATTRVVRGPVVEAFYATGTLLPHREYPVRSNLEGTLTEVLIDKGATVCKGQKLATVRVEENQMLYNQALADYQLKQKMAVPETSPAILEFDAKIKAAQDQLDIAKREQERTVAMHDAGAATQGDLDHAAKSVQDFQDQIESTKKGRATRIIELARDLEVAKGALDIAQWRLDQQTIVSPADGRVLDWPVAVGTRVKVNDHLFQVADVSPEGLVMRAQVDEEDKTLLHEDQDVKVTLYSYPGKTFEGKVVQVYPKADLERRTFEVDVAIKPPDAAFSAGMTGELAFIVQTKDSAPVVPSQAVQNSAVWIVSNGQLRKVNVEIGIKSVERTEIVHGLGPDDRVVISPSEGFVVGQHVRMTEVDPTDAANLNRPKSETAFANFK